MNIAESIFCTSLFGSVSLLIYAGYLLGRIDEQDRQRRNRNQTTDDPAFGDNWK